MKILIDGYNLLHASGVMPSGQGPGTLQRAREALLRFLAASLTPEERAQTTIVFDAREAPYNLPRVLEHDGITVRFAPRDRSADAVIEELIRADSAPKRITVVSSDHQIQKAAKRRRATAVDSDTWCGELIRRRQEQHEPTAAAKPQGPLTPGEVAFWMRKFGVESTDEMEATNDTLHNHLAEGNQNPFPPGYGEDVMDEDL